MPSLLGDHLIDASGNALQDVSSNYIAEQTIQVVVMEGGFLIDTVSAGGGSLWGTLIAWLIENLGPLVAEAILDKLLGGDPNGAIDLPAEFATVANRFDRWTPTSGLDYQTYMADLEAWLQANWPSGTGLTTEEHDQLLGLQNADLSGIPPAVWNWADVPSVGDPLKSPWYPIGWLRNIATYVEDVGRSIGYPLIENPAFNIVSDAYYLFQFRAHLADGRITGALPAPPDWSHVERGDTVATFLAREYSSYTWTDVYTYFAGTTVRKYARIGDANTPTFITPAFTDADLRKMWPGEAVGTVDVTVENLDVPPIWPGEANATLGSPVTLVDQLELNGPMDGVLVDVTTPPTRVGQYHVGGEVYDYGVGRIAFRSDRGDIEPWQYLGFRSAIFTPRSMRSASGALFQVLAGAGGTVRTFVRS